MTHRLTALGLLASSVVLSSCVRFAEVKERRPVYRPVGSSIATLASAENSIAKGLARDKRDPKAAMADYLAAAQAAQDQLLRHPNDTAARDTYNFALARLLACIRDAKLVPWSGSYRVPAEGGDYVITHRPDPRKKWNPALYEFTPADQFDVGGAYVKEHNRKEGLGAPLVAVGREMNAEAREEFSLPRIYYGVTVIARFNGRTCELALEDPLNTETIKVGARTFPLAADYSVPIAVMLASTNPEKMGLSRMLDPEKYADTARLARLQPYDPNKTVVLVVHGLNSSPATWTPLINHLRADESIRRNYQFWFFSYPTGYPYPYSASILRKELDAIQQRYPLRKKMVVIGHSMGGCISRLLVTDVGDRLWLDMFGKPPSQVPMSEESKQLYTDALIFNHRPEIGRVIFVAAPLRGADMAERWTGRLGSRLVRAPFKLARAGVEALTQLTERKDTMQMKRLPNSVDTLAPSNRFVKTINEYPLYPGIPYHTIMGDRGKGGNKDRTKPVCSDGIVPYWSSHLGNAQSELVVPSNHGAHQNPQAIDEIRRILNLHLGR